ncbi:MAG: adenylate kinase [Candidatus Eremiobacteraeota bacterium]|nr:adenylate kinase [Candidatus Eremiobacteraeota bacterium]
MRVNIIGNSGAGKTTLGKAVADVLACPFHELDDLHWGPDWTPRPREELRRSVAEVVKEPSWVIDGNYARGARDLIWPHTDLVVWLDLPLSKCLQQLLKRTTRRFLTKEALWTAGNRENLTEAIFSWNSLIVWAIRDYRPRRADNFRSLCSAEAPRSQRLCSPAERDAWLAGFRVDYSSL